MQRRRFLTSVAAATASAPALTASTERAPALPTNSRQPPRKVITGTVLQDLWGDYPGVDKRLKQLASIVERMGAESHARYGRGLDLAILPETAVTGELGGNDALSRAVPLEGPLRD